MIFFILLVLTSHNFTKAKRTGKSVFLSYNLPHHGDLLLQEFVEKTTLQTIIELSKTTQN